ncbi:MAG: MBOAT family protein [Deltaproteobacteria bacterium]|nr:MBOAT family protein [Deltaproteobacteria bacterium]
MLFNSYSFILIFLPAVAAGYFLLHHYLTAKWARLFLLIASLGFMSFWNLYFTLTLLISVLFNFALGSTLSRFALQDSKIRKSIFIAAIAANIVFLGFFKYSNFFVQNVNTLFSAHIGAVHVLLPIGISFYTFMQIAWLTDIYRRGGLRYDFLSYSLYVTFFPYVISGPIAYHHEVIPQMQSESVRRFSGKNLCRGVFIFSIGLFKKCAVADTLALIADGGFAAGNALSFTEAWLTSLSYTMQIYFDFSGYTDMAIGAALVFNIDIPANFNSPYKSMNIQDFWRRWHITLSRFLRDYIYIPLGGNRSGIPGTLVNLMLTFLIGGLWHGAAWTFVFWGFLHGAALCIHRLWSRTGIRMNSVIAWFLTFNFINVAWVFFRAQSFGDALRILQGMAGLNGVVVSPNIAENAFGQSLAAIGIRFGEWRAHLPEAEATQYFFCLILIPFVLMTKNSNELLNRFSPNWKNALAVSLMMIAGLLLLNKASTFLYFTF